MLFITIQIFLTLNFTTPIIERYDFEPNKICYVVDLGIKIKENYLKFDTEDNHNYLNCIYRPPKMEIDGEEKNKLSNLSALY
tara:strand:- start:371 stop:616 length:246 start_codon:yes stop_codon:yes gene_type:complete